MFSMVWKAGLNHLPQMTTRLNNQFSLLPSKGEKEVTKNPRSMTIKVSIRAQNRSRGLKYASKIVVCNQK